jgi:NADPH-dependent curcumin reductase CurA
MRVREIRLKRHPDGAPLESDFELAESELRDPAEGELHLRPLFLSIDAYQRNRMRAATASLLPGHVIEGRCVAEVVASRHQAFRAGDLVSAVGPWSEGCVLGGDKATLLDLEVWPPQLHLGAAGVPGLTAFVGLHDVGRLRPGEIILVSAAASAVGSIACQIAKLHGCRAIGIVGSAMKARYLVEEIGVDGAIDYSAEQDLTAALRRHCPEGIDLLFECVGGRHLEAGLDLLKPHRRVVLCGLIAGMNGQSAAPRNLDQVIAKRIAIQGFVVGDHMDRMGAFLNEMKTWLATGAVCPRDTVLEGIDSAPKAFAGLFRGENLGKMLVRVAQPSLRPEA